jgi:Repeat of unknown function (DUF5648)
MTAPTSGLTLVDLTDNDVSNWSDLLADNGEEAGENIQATSGQTSIITRLSGYINNHNASIPPTLSNSNFIAAGLSTVALVDAAVDLDLLLDFSTTSTIERDQVLATRPDLKFEGAARYEHLTGLNGDAAVYRLFKTSSGNHFSTSNATERDTVLATRNDMKFEGIAFYTPTGAA